MSKGCFTPSVSTSVFNLAPSEEDSKIYAEASLLEAGTGIRKVCLRSFGAEKVRGWDWPYLGCEGQSRHTSSSPPRCWGHHRTLGAPAWGAHCTCRELLYQQQAGEEWLGAWSMRPKRVLETPQLRIELPQEQPLYIKCARLGNVEMLRSKGLGVTKWD